MKVRKLLQYILFQKRFILTSVLVIPVATFFFINNLASLVHASWGSWGDSGYVSVCVGTRGAISFPESGSCKTNEAQEFWVKDIEAGSGLTKTTNSSGITLSLASATADGWTAAGETWTYASADDPTFTFTISGDKTDKYSPGMRVKLTQTTTKYFLITGVAYSSPNTTVTVYGGTDYDLANASITNPYLSNAKAPQGFPLNPAKWTVEVTDSSDRTVTSPSKSTWYNPDASLQILIPVGVWDVEYHARPGASASSATWAYSRVTLSTANNSESDPDMTGIAGMDAASGTLQSYSAQYRRKTVSLTSKTTYYLNVWGNTSAGSLDALRIRGLDSKTILRAISSYL